MAAKPQTPTHLKYDPGPVTSEFLQDRESRALLLIGPVGTGKTTAAAFKQIMLTSKWVKPDNKGKRRTRYAVIRNTYGDLKDSTIRAYLDWFPPGDFGGRYHQTDKNAYYYIGDREIEICFRALDDENDVRHLLSTEYSGGHIDEAKEIPHIIASSLMSRFRYPPKKDYADEDPFLVRPQLLLTTNYPNRDHWLYRDFVAAIKVGYRIFEQTQEENKHNLPDNYYENQAIDFADRPDMLRTLVLGQWGMTYKGKLVYPEWNQWPTGTFLAPGPLQADSGRLIHRGWDNTGLHPACVISQLNAQLQWDILAEFWDEDTGITEFTEWVHLFCQDRYNGGKFADTLDPASINRGNDPTKGSSLDWMKKYFNQVGAEFNWQHGIQTFTTRREAVASRLAMAHGRPLMRIDPSCRLVIDGFDGGYHRKEIGNSGIYRNEPHKDKYCDCFARGTMVRTVVGETPIEELKVGDWVDTPVGYRRVTATMSSYAPTVELVTSEGAVRCTTDHRFARPNGFFTCVDALEYDSILIGISTAEVKEWLRHADPTRISTASDSISTTASRITTSIRAAVEKACTAMSGNFTTVKFQGGGAYTIKTTMDLTTESKIWKSIQQVRTHHTMAKKDILKILNRPKKGLLPPEKQQKYGMPPRKEGRGTAYTGKTHGKTEPKSFASVPGAVQNTTLISLDFVQTNAFTMQGLRRGLMTLLALAANVARSLPSINTAKKRPAVRFVQLRKPIESELVYDVTVDDVHVFYANGILVSNCHDAMQYTATRLFTTKIERPKPQSVTQLLAGGRRIRGDFG